MSLDAYRRAIQATQQTQQQTQQNNAFQQGLMSGAPPMPTNVPPMTYFPGYGPNGVAGAKPAPMMQSGGGK